MSLETKRDGVLRHLLGVVAGLDDAGDVPMKLPQIERLRADGFCSPCGADGEVAGIGGVGNRFHEQRGPDLSVEFGSAIVLTAKRNGWHSHRERESATGSSRQVDRATDAATILSLLVVDEHFHADRIAFGLGHRRDELDLAGGFLAGGGKRERDGLIHFQPQRPGRSGW